MKTNEIKTVKLSKVFQEKTGKDSKGVDVGGHEVKWEYPDYEWLIEELKVPEHLRNVFKFIYRGGAENTRHHLVSDWYKDDAAILIDKKATQEQKTAAAKRMKYGYVFDYSKPPTKSGQTGKERTGNTWGRLSAWVPAAKKIIGEEFKEDTDEWKKEILRLAQAVKDASEKIKNG